MDPHQQQELASAAAGLSPPGQRGALLIFEPIFTVSFCTLSLPTLFWISEAMVRKAFSTLLAFLALVSRI